MDQLAELQARRDQIEMLIEWREGLQIRGTLSQNSRIDGKVVLSAIMPLLPTAGLKQQPQLLFSKIGDRAEGQECHCKSSLHPRCGYEGLICQDEK
jgi:hypothetical protein